MKTVNISLNSQAFALRGGVVMSQDSFFFFGFFAA